MGLELLHLSALVAAARKGALRREVPDGVVTPVIFQALVGEGLVIDVLVNGSSSTALTPSFFRYSMAAVQPTPAYVPRSSSGTSGQSLVNPVTCTS